MAYDVGSVGGPPNDPLSQELLRNQALRSEHQQLYEESLKATRRQNERLINQIDALRNQLGENAKYGEQLPSVHPPSPIVQAPADYGADAPGLASLPGMPGRY